MEWKNGLTSDEKKRRKEDWHKWFAWFPVVIGITADHHRIKAWLQVVERKGRFKRYTIDYTNYYNYYYEYRKLEKKEG